MPKITINEELCSDFFTKINSLIEDNLTTDIGNFNKELDVLNDGKTWRGSAAVTQVGELIKIYNAYLGAYNNLITYFVEEVPKIFVHYSEIVVAAGGQSLVVKNVSADTFKTKTLNDLSFAGNDGDPGELERIKPILQTATEGIQSTFKNIKNEMLKIGNGSDIFDTSAADINYAENLKTEVNDYISDLDSTYQEGLLSAIAEIEKSAKTLRS